MKERNQTFVYLYVLTILMVIDDHCGTRIGFLSGIFPYNSFYMPLFVFASGYFFHQRPFWDTLKRRTKRILLPYIVWDVVMVALAFPVDAILHVNWSRKPSVLTVVRMLVDSPTTTLNGAAWFAIMIFWLSILYTVLRMIVRSGIVQDCILTLVLVALGMIAVYLCIYHMPQDEYALFAMRLACRTLFFLQFYHLGYVFKKYFEAHMQRLNKGIVCIVCVIVNMCLILVFGDKINFTATYAMTGFHYVVLPLITSITGILFYYEVMSFLADMIGEMKATSFIARNTFVIMQVHLLLVNIPNMVVFWKINHGATQYPDFPVETFIDSAWTAYNSNARLIGFFCGLVGSLLIALGIERVQAWYRMRKGIN